MTILSQLKNFLSDLFANLETGDRRSIISFIVPRDLRREIIWSGVSAVTFVNSFLEALAQEEQDQFVHHLSKLNEFRDLCGVEQQEYLATLLNAVAELRPQQWEEEFADVVDTVLTHKFVREFFEGGVDLVKLDEQVIAPEAAVKGYYKGEFTLNWGIIAAQGDIKRDQKEGLLKELTMQTKRTRMFCISGEPGSGKSTLAWRLAAEAAQALQQPILHIRLIYNNTIWFKLNNFIQECRIPPIILVDDVFRNDQARYALESLDPASNVTIISTSRSNEIPGPIKLPFSMEERPLQPPSRNEKRQVLQKLDLNESNLEISRQKRLEEADSWIIMMIEITTGEALSTIVRDNVKRLEQIDTIVYQAYEYLCYAGQYDLAVPETLIAALDERGRVYNLLEHSGGKGLIFSDDRLEGRIRTQHPIIASEALRHYGFGGERNPFVLLNDFLSFTQPDQRIHRHFLQSLLSSLMLHQKGQLVRRLLEQRAAAINRIVTESKTDELLRWADLYDMLGEQDKASQLKKIALRLDPELPVDWLALLRLTEEEGIIKNIGALIDKTADWLRANPRDTTVRQAHLGLVQRHGTSEQIRVLIDDLATWVSTQPENNSIRRAYLKILAQDGTPEQVANLFSMIASWAANNVQNPSGSKIIFLKLIGNSRTQEQIRRLIDSITTSWLDSGIPNHHAIELQRRLIEQYGTEEQISALIGTISSWLKTPLQDVQIRSLYLGLVGSHGTEKQIADLISSTGSWLVDNPQDTEVRSVYLDLVRQRGTEEQIAALIPSTAAWLVNHLQDTEVRRQYLKLIENHGTKEQMISTLDDAALWLIDNPQDNRVCMMYFSLVGRGGTKKQIEDLLDIIADWEMTDQKKSMLFFNFLASVEREWPLDQKRSMIYVLIEKLSVNVQIILPYNLLLDRFGSEEEIESVVEYISSWLGTNLQDSQIRSAYLKLLERHGTAEQRAAAIESTASWLAAHAHNSQIRLMYLKLLERRGTTEQCIVAIESTKRWLEDNSEDIRIWSIYLELVRRFGTAEQSGTAIKSTASWLAANPQDSLVRSAYLKLLERRGTVEQNVASIDSAADWLATHLQDFQARRAYLELVARRGTAEQCAAALKSTMSWLITNPHDYQTRSAYLGLIEWWGTAAQIKDVLESTETWLATNSQDFQVRRAYLELVRRRGTEEQSAVALVSTEVWLATNPQDSLVRSAYLKLLARRGTVAQSVTALASTEVWLTAHLEDSLARSAYLWLMGRRGTAAQIAATLESTVAWLATNLEDFQVRHAYLELVGRHGTEEQITKALEATEAWLATNPQDFHVRRAYLELARQRGTEEESAVALKSTEVWLATNPQDSLVRSAYLKLLARRGTAEQFTKVEKEVNDWLSHNPENIPLRLVLAAIEKRRGEYVEARRLFEEAIKANRLNSGCWRAWAIMEKELGDYEEARRLFRNATEVDPGNTPSWQAWATMEKTQGNYEEARRLFTKATDIDPGYAPPWRARALMEKELGRFEWARLFFQKATDVDSKHTPSWSSWAIMEKDLDNHEEAQRLFSQATRNSTRPAEMWSAWAIMEKELHNFDEARRLFTKATDVDPGHTPSWSAWAIMEKDLGNHEEARRLFSQATGADLKEAGAWQAWAIMEKELGNHEDARRLFQKATAVDSKHTPSWSAWAIMEKELGNYEKARSLFREVTWIDPKSEHSWRSWAIMEKELGDYDEARRLFREAIRISPEEAGLWSAWAIMEKELGDYEEARSLFQKATKVRRKSTYGWQPWAIMEKELGNYEKARSLFQEATNINPKPVGMWSAWAIMEKELGDYEEARRLFQDATRIGRKNIYAWQPWAIMEKELGNYEEARRLFSEAIKTTNPVSALSPWALLELEQGNLNKARQYALQAVDLAPQNFYALIARGQVQHAWGNLERAKADFEQAKQILQLQLKNRPNDPRHLNLLGRVLTLMGDYQQAQTILLHSLEIATHSQKAYAHNGLGELYEAQKMFDAAVNEWRKALEYFPHYLAAKNNLNRILQPSSADGEKDGNASQLRKADQDPVALSENGVALDGLQEKELPGVPINIAPPITPSESLAKFLKDGHSNLHPFEQLAADIVDISREERLDKLAESLQLDLPESLCTALTTLPADPLIGLVYRVYGPPLSPPSVFGALVAMLAGEQPPPDDLVPLMAVDDASLACVVCCRKGLAHTPEFGQVVRWHLRNVRERAQRQILDITVKDFLETAATDRKWRDEGIERMRQIVEEHDKMKESGESLPKADQERPIRLAVQNVIVGLAALRHESAFDALSCRVWQTCQVPHVNAHEGNRALAAVTLAEAFRSGGTMEIRFDEHPEKAVPASLRQYGRTRGLVLGREDSRVIAPAEARQLFLAVTQMPEELATRVSRIVEAGILSPERVCSLLLSGIWRPIELDFILASTTHASSILRGGLEPFNRPARQVELAVCRVALMVGMLQAQLNRMVTERAEVENAPKDEQRNVRWSILEDYAAVRFDQVPPGSLPWQQDRKEMIEAGQSLVFVPRPLIGSQDIELAARLSQELNAIGVTLQLYGTPHVKVTEVPVLQLTCPKSIAEIDRIVEERLVACKVGRI